MQEEVIQGQHTSGALLQTESSAKTWTVNNQSGEGFSYFFPYLGKILQKGKGG
jgi:hypothetical protein